MLSFLNLVVTQETLAMDYVRRIFSQDEEDLSLSVGGKLNLTSDPRVISPTASLLHYKVDHFTDVNGFNRDVYIT